MVTPLHHHTFANGVQLVVLPLAHARLATAAVFVHGGSRLEPPRLAGLTHAVEHMVFKGTARRSARQLNVDAERLGSEVNAHTDRDHTAFYMSGLPTHVRPVLEQLAEIVGSPSFPADEVERERQVLLHEFTEDEDDPMSTTFKLFDACCWGSHPLARPVIGSRRTLETFSRDDLVAWVAEHHAGCRMVVGVAGPVDPDDVRAAAEAAFGALARGQPLPRLDAPVWHGGTRTRRLTGSGQAHVVLGFPIPGREADDPSGAVAAAVLGEGMSSPLLQALREQRALAYYTACSADVLPGGGQLVFEASTAPGQLGETLEALRAVAERAARHVEPDDLLRAHNQLVVRALQAEERPLRRLEDAALDLFAFGRIRQAAEVHARRAAVDAAAVRRRLTLALESGAALAMGGSLPRAASELARGAIGSLLKAA